MSADRPFFFWLGTTEPHAPFAKNPVRAPSDRDVKEAIPPFLPDHPAVYADLRGYAAEIELADRHLGAVLHALEMAGRLDETIVIATSDNGMPFPRGKANLYDAGTRVPLAIRWPAGIAPGRIVDKVVSLLDLAPTLFAAAGISPFEGMVGRDLSRILADPKKNLPADGAVFHARERHSYSRKDNLGYPARAIRTDNYLYIVNIFPERAPAGDPRGFGDDRWGYYDIDVTATKALLCGPAAEHDPVLRRFRALAVDSRPAEELYDIHGDPGNLINRAKDPQYAPVLADLRKRLEQERRHTDDARLADPSGAEREWESYIRHGKMRHFD